MEGLSGGGVMVGGGGLGGCRGCDGMRKKMGSRDVSAREYVGYDGLVGGGRGERASAIGRVLCEGGGM